MATDEDHVEQATTFDPSDAPHTDRLDGTESHREKYERLAVANGLDWNGTWLDERRATAKDNSAIADAVASSFDLTPAQKERVQLYRQNLPDKFKQSDSSAAVAIVICMKVGNEDGRDYSPHMAQVNAEPNVVKRLCNGSNISYKRLLSVWRRVGEELP